MNNQKKRTIKIKIPRTLVDGSLKEEVYEVPYIEGMSVYTALQHIYEQIDSSLSFFISCRLGLCGRCDIIVDGESVLACTEIVTDDIKVETPRILGFRAINDLVSDHVFIKDRDKFFFSNTQAQQRFSKAYDSCADAGG